MSKLRAITDEELESATDTRAWLDEAGKHWGFHRVVWLPAENPPQTEYADGAVFIYKPSPADAVLELLYTYFEKLENDTGFFNLIKNVEASCGLDGFDWSKVEEYD